MGRKSRSRSRSSQGSSDTVSEASRADREDRSSTPDRGKNDRKRTKRSRSPDKRAPSGSENRDRGRKSSDGDNSGTDSSDSVSSPERCFGIVKKLMSNGYGFIKPVEGGEDVFLHATAVEEGEFQKLRTNDKVSFEIGIDTAQGKPRAYSVRFER